MCPELSRVENGNIQLSSGQLLGTTAEYICDDGFVIDGGDNVRRCSSNGASVIGVWTGRAPSCLSMFMDIIMHADALHLHVTILSLSS